MLELSTIRKNKVNLSDYNCEQDIENRSLLADLSFFEHSVLQEIFFSPIKFSLKKLARTLECEEKALTPILEKLSKAKLLSVLDDAVTVDKEMRKYFEFHMKRFDEDFKPDMEYFQGILRKVPIHLLPNWYAIPRTSNNIFESIVEKYLQTPQLFHRYLSELNFSNPIAHQIIHDVFTAPDLKVASSDLITKYNLTRHEFEQILILLEFSCVCCVTYTKGEDLWIEWVSPFHEWHEYLKFFKMTDAPSIPSENKIIRERKSDFSFVEDLSALLRLSQKVFIPEYLSQNHEAFKQLSLLLSLSEDKEIDYIAVLMKKAMLLQLADSNNGRFTPTDIALDFLSLTLEKRALYLYRHPFNRILHPNLPEDLATEKNIRETEKAIKTLVKKQWVYFDEFLKGTTICLHEGSQVSLKKIGKSWKYALPSYSDKEVCFIKLVMLEWLFEVGMTAIGSHNGQDCLTLTPFGRFFFEE
jgi:hypothetical protein